MQVTRENPTPTTVKLSIIADSKLMDAAKQTVLTRLGTNVRVQGFRSGKAPAHLIAKQIDQNALQSEFLDYAVNQLYIGAIQSENLRPAEQPQVNITKFVPFTTLEIVIEVEAVGKVKLPDYKKTTVKREAVTATAKDVDEVLATLRTRAATKVTVERAAKDGDEVIIDFSGTDFKTKEPIAGTDGKDFPLVLGSKSFIPGFEDKLVGLKADDSKDFPITFPKDYGATELQSKKVTFSVTVKEVKELAEPKLDDAFAATVGPFKNLAELKADVKKQLIVEKEQTAEREFDNKLLEEIANKTTVAIPKSLVDEEIVRIEEEEKRNLVYRGQTWQEHLDQENVTEEQHRENNRPNAELRIKAGIVLSEIADLEKITVTTAEVDVRMQLLRDQYASDPAMLAELDKLENRRDITSRLLTEKALDRLKSFSEPTKK